MFKQSAKQVFSRTNYQAAEEDINALARNMALLEGQGLGDLNRRLMDANNKVFDTVAEHNVASMLLRHFGKSAQIEYELPGHGNRPVDFRVQTSENGYWLQMKRFADLERENRKDRLLDKLKQDATEIKTPKFFDCELGDDFPEHDLPQLVQFLKETAPTSQEEVQYDYPNCEKVKARARFWDSPKELLQGLTLRWAGDMSMVDITGLSSDQLRASVRKTAGAFAHAVDSNNINLVIAEADRQNDIVVGEACFGSEEEVISRDGRGKWWRRQNNGVFSESNISKNVVGLIALRRPDGRKPISNYTMVLYMNDKHVEYLPAIQGTFPIQRIIHSNMRPKGGTFA